MKRMRKIELTTLLLGLIFQVGIVLSVLISTGGDLKYAKYHRKDGIIYYSTAKYQAAGWILLGLVMVILLEVIVVYLGIISRTYLAGVVTAVGSIMVWGILIQAFYNGGSNLKSYLIKLMGGFMVMAISYMWSRKKMSNFKAKLVACISIFLILLNLSNLIIGNAVNGSYGWVLGIQPGEILKPLLILLAAYTYRFRIEKRMTRVYLGICFSSIVILALSHDLGNASILLVITLVSIWFLNVDMRMIFMISATAIIGVFVSQKYVPYIRNRFALCFNVLKFGEKGNQQLYRSIMGILLQGLNGCGPAGDTVEATSLYASSTDLVANVLISIFGISALASVVLLLGLLVYEMLITPIVSPFHFLVAFLGVVVLTTQTLIHVGGDLNIFPFTGICLPFLSLGGWNTVVNFSLLGGIFGCLAPSFSTMKISKISGIRRRTNE